MNCFSRSKKSDAFHVNEIVLFQSERTDGKQNDLPIGTASFER